MYTANENRYEKMMYNRVGNSGLKISALSLGLWHNFGNVDVYENGRALVTRAFDLGITHFDLANNYGPPAGSAEENFARILETDLKPYRDELVISTKAGYYMWPGPYGDGGSKKYLVSSLDQSLKRLKLDYVDIYYHHRPDEHTPLEETAEALDLLVRQGKALYVGVSNYSPEQTRKIAEIFEAKKTPFIIHQPSYNMFNRWIEDGLKDVLMEKQIGAIAFSPLAQGLLTDRYLNGIPVDSRANRETGLWLHKENVEETIEKVKALNVIAKNRGQSLAEMAVAWILRDGIVTSVLIGASKVSQVEANVKALENITFSADELVAIDKVLKG
ncbi:L-glyceraldehyde 3-phosphate reductase [Bacillus sp. B1-b2]|uniref:L-glyceraldehyde 3-phosphate reductase n=1 Tax=Bacillus sp. B1-b2 TaxID=2653201 RepID=UPI001261B68D|nr:L-glyceraldehyde 3-phosphate reductase [Bacillus sp. B1-b2]KAB7671773.1 L-glyceraldehyde 3-phosphate reductase [Bacillus sp. B1-b2]